MRRFDPLGWLTGGERSLPLRQLPTAIAFFVAVVVVFCAPDVHLADLDATVVGTVQFVIASALSLILDRRARHSRWAMAVPLLSLLAIGAFRAGTGGSGSLFSAMLVLPVVWIASEAGRWNILLAAVASSLAYYTPYLVGFAEFDPTDPTDVWHGLFTPFVLALLAITINELARRGRERLQQLTASELRSRSAERFTRSVLDAVTEQAVIGTDLDGVINVWNPGAISLLAYGPDEMIGRRNITDLHDPVELEGFPHGPAGAFEVIVGETVRGARDVREWTYLRADGSTMPVEVAVTQRLGESGAPEGYLFVAADMTRAHEAAKVRDEFVGLVSHELRTPISAVLGHLELLRIDPLAPLTIDQSRYVAVAERNARRLLRLVGDLLFTAQVEAGRFPLERQSVALASIIDAAVESAAPVAAAAGVDLEVDLVNPAVTVDADPLRLGQAVDNLVSNALKFTPRGGRVVLTLATQNGSACLRVRDNGRGIPQDELRQLFGRFFRASTATRNAIPGIGLGLTITKAIVTAHEGTIDVESEEGVGTEFTITLPLGGSDG